MDWTQLEPIRTGFLRWIDSVAELIARVRDSLAQAPQVLLVEQADRSFRLEGADGVRLVLRDGALAAESGAVPAAIDGAEVRMALAPDRFVRRELDLPARASAFLDGVIRAQIDRITPWSAAQAAWGMRSAPAPDDRISVTVAAAARSLVEDFARAAGALGAHSVVVLAGSPDADDAAIEVYRHKAQEARAAAKLRGALVAALGVAAAFAVGSLIVAGSIESRFAAAQEAVEAQAAQDRRALQAGPVVAGSAAALHREKAQAPLATLVIETLSRALPDDVWLAGLELRGDSIRISGVTPDASKVVGLIERAPTFSRATFAAPTVRSTTEPGERFQIEARVNPVYPKLK